MKRCAEEWARMSEDDKALYDEVALARRAVSAGQAAGD